MVLQHCSAQMLCLSKMGAGPVFLVNLVLWIIQNYKPYYKLSDLIYERKYQWSFFWKTLMKTSVDSVVFGSYFNFSLSLLDEYDVSLVTFLVSVLV